MNKKTNNSLNINESLFLALCFVGISWMIVKEMKHECDIKVEHAHLYKHPTKFDKYELSNKLFYPKDYEMSDEYIIVDEDVKKRLKAENKDIEKDPLKEGYPYRININEEKIKKLLEEYKDTVECNYDYYQTKSEWKYTNGKFGLVTSTKSRAGWEKSCDFDKEPRAKRFSNLKFYRYKLVLNEDGKYEFIKSDLYSRYEDIPEEYDYIIENFFEKEYYPINVNPNGSNDDKSHITFNEEEKIKKLTRL